MSASSDRWWETTPLEQMTKEQWESLCDGCGRCCLVKCWQGSKVKYAKVACQLMDIKTGKCTDYDNRFDKVSNCYQVTLGVLDKPGLLPNTCAYRLIKDGKPLYDWHHLISGSRNTVHEAGVSIVGFAEANNMSISAATMADYMRNAVDLEAEFDVKPLT